MAAGSTYTPIETRTLGSAQTSVTFNSISQSYTDIVLVAKISIPSGAAFGVQVGNGSVDTGSNYSFTNIVGNGSTATSGRGTSASYISFTQGNQFAPTTLNNTFILNFQNYSNSSTYKTILQRASVTETSTGFASSTVGLWRSPSAINTINFYCQPSFTFDTGSTFTLYGIAAA